MIDSLWLPKLNVDAAFRWLNCDTYWDIPESDPADSTSTAIPSRNGSRQTAYPKEIKEKYPLTLISGRPRQSRLRDLRVDDLNTRTPLEQLVLQLRADVFTKSNLIAHTRMQFIEDFCSPLQANPSADRLQLTEARLEFGRAYALLDEIDSAITTLEQCAHDFHGNDLHNEAITLWMLGYVELIANDNPKNGLVAWERAWEIFADYAKDNRRPKAEINWYHARAKIMFADLQDAIGFAQVSPAPPHVTPEPPTPASAAAPKPQQPSPAKKIAQNHWLRFKQIDVYESVRAHPKGGIVTKESDRFAEANTIWIDNKEYRLYSATARRVITLNPDPKVNYSFVRVEGDSMIEAIPTIIEEGDYVLVQIDRDPDDEEIVVATYHDPQTGDVTGAVKLKRSDGLHSKNSAKNYTIVPLENVKYVGKVIAIAKP